MIINSFKSCGLTVAVDGSEDGHILCFKKKQPCHAGLERLKVAQQTMSNSREWVTEDAEDATEDAEDDAEDAEDAEDDAEDAVEDAAPESLITDASDTDAIDVEIN